MPSIPQYALAAGITAVIATAAFAAENFNSSRSNVSSEIPVRGKLTAVSQSYKFSWSYNAGESKLSKKERQALLEIAFREIRKDVLR